MHTGFPSKHSYTRRILWKIVSIIRVIQHHKCIMYHRNSVRVVPLKAPRWQMKWAYVGYKWTHGMNPIWVQLFRIRYVIGRSKTRTGFENHMLSHTRGRLVPRQPRAFKSTTRTELIVLPYFKKQIMSDILVQYHTALDPNRTISRRDLWKIVSIIRAILYYNTRCKHRNSVQVVLLKAPRWRMEWAYMGNK